MSVRWLKELRVHRPDLASMVDAIHAEDEERARKAMEGEHLSSSSSSSSSSSLNASDARHPTLESNVIQDDADSCQNRKRELGNELDPPARATDHFHPLSV